jgi:hypothetical protein
VAAGARVRAAPTQFPNLNCNMGDLSPCFLVVLPEIIGVLDTLEIFSAYLFQMIFSVIVNSTFRSTPLFKQSDVVKKSGVKVERCTVKHVELKIEIPSQVGSNHHSRLTFTLSLSLPDPRQFSWT